MVGFAVNSRTLALSKARGLAPLFVSRSSRAYGVPLSMESGARGGSFCRSTAIAARVRKPRSLKEDDEDRNSGRFPTSPQAPGGSVAMALQGQQTPHRRPPDHAPGTCRRHQRTRNLCVGSCSAREGFRLAHPSAPSRQTTQPTLLTQQPAFTTQGGDERPEVLEAKSQRLHQNPGASPTSRPTSQPVADVSLAAQSPIHCIPHPLSPLPVLKHARTKLYR